MKDYNVTLHLVVFSGAEGKFLQTCPRCRLTERAALPHLTPRSTSATVNRQSSCCDNALKLTWQITRDHKRVEGKKNNASPPDVPKRTATQAVAWKKGDGKKVTVIVNKKRDKPAEAHARSPAWRRELFNLPNKCRQCEAVSQKKPRWTEKRLQYDLFREA